MAPRVLLCMICLSGTVFLASAQPSVAHFGGGGYSHPREPALGALSKYNTATKLYDPVTSDKQYYYYRMKVHLNETFGDFFWPDPNTLSILSGVASGDVFDNSTGVQAGTFNLFTISTAYTATKEVTYLAQLAWEMGPKGDDAIYFQTGVERANVNQAPNDFDLAISGGTGRYKGATGEGQHFGTAISEPNSDNLYVLEVAVPRFKRF